ncbi:MAG: hypothetical protein JXX14_21990 [Deltaproteobacteria bacterium]|nr:hypothetical protein [Deltaproteobacteria bacterium]
MRPNSPCSRHILPTVLVMGLLMSTGCRLVTNSRIGMQVKVSKYFDEEGRTYPKLDDNIFKMKMRLSGVLTPQKFVKEIGIWVFLLEPHDPGKTPILFLHGHWTGPPVFREMLESIDTDKYEPWLVFYPSGLDIRETTRFLQLNLARLSKYYNQDEIYIIAYSMGGVLARETIVSMKPAFEMPRIPLFIGIANPWGGSIPTTAGANVAITANPDSNFSYGAEAWKQVHNTAPFVKHMFDRKMPKETEFHMIYSVGGEDPDLPGRDDGMLHEGSLGRPEALAEAKSVTIFEKPTHASIISHYLAIQRTLEILADFEARKQQSSPQPP